MRKILLTLGMLAAPRVALACPVCFGDNDSPMAVAMMRRAQMNETASPSTPRPWLALAPAPLAPARLPMIALRDAEKRSTRTHAATAIITDRIASVCPQNGE